MLRRGDLVIMDNLSPHKNDATRALIEQTGATVAFLSAYSPDLNSIEKMWIKVKQFLRSAGGSHFGGIADGHRRRCQRQSPRCIGQPAMSTWPGSRRPANTRRGSPGLVPRPTVRRGAGGPGGCVRVVLARAFGSKPV